MFEAKLSQIQSLTSKGKVFWTEHVATRLHKHGITCHSEQSEES